MLYISQSQVIVSAIFFYNMRVLERLFGSRKYLSFIVLILVFSIIAVPLTNLVASHFPILSSILYKAASSYIPPGPTAIVFAVLVLYKELIPSVYRFQITPVSSPFTLVVSDKFFVYLTVADLFLLGIPGSLSPAIVGWVLGNLIYFEVIPGKNWRIPAFIMGPRKLHSQTTLFRTHTQSSLSSSAPAVPSSVSASVTNNNNNNNVITDTTSLINSATLSPSTPNHIETA